mmetsp:Transcript_27634/g.74785  ORF Transcript_27634/g.74785 Transcript_27634/m.74785 type:complete len:272 (-) Transcript_27634:849-1664(-)
MDSRKMPVGFFPDLKLNVATRSSSEMELGLLEVQRLEPGMRMRGPFLGGGGTPPTLAKRLASAFSCFAATSFLNRVTGGMGGTTRAVLPILLRIACAKFSMAESMPFIMMSKAPKPPSKCRGSPKEYKESKDSSTSLSTSTADCAHPSWPLIATHFSCCSWRVTHVFRRSTWRLAHSTVTTFKGSANGHLQKLASVPTPWFLAANCTAEGKSRAIATDLATSLSSLRAALNALPTKGSNFGPLFIQGSNNCWPNMACTAADVSAKCWNMPA